MLETSAREDLPWWLAGRRVLVHGSDRAGVREIQLPGGTLAMGMVLEVAGQVPETTLVRVAPDEVVRVLRAGAVELTERITVALDHGLVCWGVVADAPVRLTLRWASPLAPLVAPRADPAVVQEEGPVDPDPAPAPGVHLAGPSGHLAVTAYSGTVHRSSRAGETPAICVAEGDRVLRLVFACGATDAELQRSRDAFARRRLRAFRQDRILHARRLEQRLTALESADPTLDRAFQWAKIRLDAAIVETAGAGRWPRLPGVPASTARACALARAALAGGDREPALDLVRLLAQAGAPAVPGDDGRNDAEAAAAGVLDLAIAVAAWTGDRAALERIATLLPMDVGALMGRVASAGADVPHGWDDPATVRSVLGFRPEQLDGSPRLVRAVIEGLWGIVPDAPHDEVRVTPGLPSEWPEMALRRLRVGASQLDVRIRRRPGRQVLRVELVQGPRIRMVAELPAGLPVEQLLLDDEPLGGRRAVFDVEHSHEVVFQLADG